MSKDKLKLPSSISKPDAVSNDSQISDSVRNEMLKTQRSFFENETKVEVAKLELAKEGIEAVKALFDLLKSHKELQATCEEWKGRVDVAENAVKQAGLDLEKARENSKPEIEKLAQLREAQTRLLSLFDEVLKSMKDADLSEEERKDARQYLLQLSDRIVQLKK